MNRQPGAAAGSVIQRIKKREQYLLFQLFNGIIQLLY